MADTKKAVFLAEVVAGAGAIAFLNHRYGAGEIKLGTAANGAGGIPLDGSLGLAGAAYCLWKPGHKLCEHLLPVSIGLLAGFAYRTGAAMGDKSAAAAATTTHTTAGLSAAQTPKQLGPASIVSLSSYANQRRAVAAGAR